jgi:hypothetical protein
MTSVVTHYTIPSAPPHYFSKDDIGKEFVRTSPWCGYDWSYIPESSSLSKIKADAMKLVELSKNYLKFYRDVPYERFSFRFHILDVVSPWNGESWDDGQWISIEALDQGLSEGTITIKPITMRCAGFL